MTTHVAIVPKWVRIVLGLLALANIAFGISGYFNMGGLFHDLTNIDVNNAAIKFGSYEFAARNLAIGLALGIVSLRGVPESITIVTIIRALIELQSVIIGFATGNINAGVAVAVVIFALELFIIKTMIGVIAKRDAQK
ncbi:MAG: hypothetical protein ABI388_09725 [Bacteroidia bacterium]